jgi:hypothetical protein
MERSASQLSSRNEVWNSWMRLDRTLLTRDVTHVKVFRATIGISDEGFHTEIFDETNATIHNRLGFKNILTG